MNSSMPKKIWVSIIQKPPTKNQSIFIKVLKQPDGFCDCITSLPNGQIANIPNLIVCIPKGIPIIVANSTKLATKYSRAMANPPKINHIKLPRNFILKKSMLLVIYIG